jgi:uncharacterized protein (TIGR00369 family)
MSMPFSLQVPFVQLLGFTLEKFENGEAEVHYSPKPEHLNFLETTHGGAIMTLMDVVMAGAARSMDPEFAVMTIEMKTSFMRPAKSGPEEHLVAKGKLLHRTQNMAFTEGFIFDPSGQLCAHSTATFKYTPRPGPRGHSKVI